MTARRVSLALGLVLLAACTRRTPRTAVGALAPGLDGFVAAHPLASGQAIRIDEVGRTAGASFHLVQARGSETPHRHAAHDLTVVVLRGQGTLTLEGARLVLAAGDVVVVPRGAAHWFANEGRPDALALVAIAPPLDAPDVVPVYGR